MLKMKPSGMRIKLKARKIYNFKVVCMAQIGNVISALGVMMFNFKLDPLNEKFVLKMSLKLKRMKSQRGMKVEG